MTVEVKPVFVRITKNKLLNPSPHCLHRLGVCELVKSGKRKCLDAPCRYQFLKIEFDQRKEVK